VSYLLKLLGRGLDLDTGDLLGGYLAPTPEGAPSPDGSDRPPNQRPNEHLQQGLTLLEQQRLPEAIDQLQRACRERPAHWPSLLALAVAQQDSADLSGAWESFRRVLRTGGRDAPIAFSAGLCCERLGRVREAADCYRTALEADSQFAAARDRLAAIALFADDVDEAIEQYEARRDLAPEKTWIRSTLGQLYYVNGQCAQAMDELQTAIAMGPENWALADDQVEALAAEGRLEEAIGRIRKMLAQQGPFADLYVRLGDLHAQQGKDEQALHNYLAALDIEPTYIEAMVKVGTAHLLRGRLEEAGESFHRAAELNDRLVFDYAALGAAQLADGRRAEANNTFELAAAIEPNSTLLLAETTRLQLKAAETDAAAEDALQAGLCFYSTAVDEEADELLARQLARHAEQVRRRPDLAELRWRYGVLLRHAGKMRESGEQFAEAVRINPHYTKATVSLALAQYELGRKDEAAETFTRAVERDDQAVGLHYRLGLLYADGRALQEAFREMDAAFVGKGDAGQVRAGLSLCLQNMGLMDSAAATWRSLCAMSAA